MNIDLRIKLIDLSLASRAQATFRNLVKACDRFFKMAAYEVVHPTKISVNIMIIV